MMLFSLILTRSELMSMSSESRMRRRIEPEFVGPLIGNRRGRELGR